MSRDNYSERPTSIGILACELYVPSLYVEQSSLENYDNVSQGRYTIGLGQQRMAICSDHEDVCSLCLTVLMRLLDQTGVHPQQIGRLDVGTETIVDKAKSIKTVLMQIFAEHGNYSVEGVDNINACYGGTAAVFNAIHWIESSFWDGRYAVVVMGDIAVYAKGNARPTGGAGACALLIGPNAPLVFEPGCRSTFMKHVYDFYKPDLSSPYPVVDGNLSVQCYMSALDHCYSEYCEKALAKAENSKAQEINLNNFIGVVFHTPFIKLVQKSFARLFLHDALRSASHVDKELVEKFKRVDLPNSINDKDLERDLIQQSQTLFNEKTNPSLHFSKNMGNMYTPSVYYGLFSYLSSFESDAPLFDRRILLFSYGSGLASSMYSLVCRKVEDSRFTLSKMQERIRFARNELDNHRFSLSPSLMDRLLTEREHNDHRTPFVPSHPIETLKFGQFYLKSVDAKHRRFYEKFSKTNEATETVEQLYKLFFEKAEISDRTD